MITYLLVFKREKVSKQYTKTAFSALPRINWFISATVYRRLSIGYDNSQDKNLYRFEGIIISACLEYNDHTTEFQDYCQHLCDIAFYLAYSEVEAMEPEQKTSLQIEDYCAKVAQDLLQTVFLSVARKKLEMETIQATADSSHNEALSHNSVYELEERLGRISEGSPPPDTLKACIADDENESGSTSSDEEDRHGYEVGHTLTSMNKYSVTELGKRRPSKSFEHTANEWKRSTK